MATYAIVKTGGKQYKVAVGDVVKVEKLESEPGSEVLLPVALVVDGAKVTTGRQGPGKGRGHRRGARAHQGTQDPYPQVQEQRPATTSGRVTVSS